MKNFLRLVALALRNRGTLVGVLLSSLLVGALWGANISIVYPFVEVVMNEKTLTRWLDDEINRAEEELSDWQSDRDELLKRGDSTSLLDARIEAQQFRLSIYRDWKPFIASVVPTDKPFRTLVFVVGVLVIGTMAKCFCLVINMVLVERLVQLAMFDLRKQFFRQTLALDLGVLGSEQNGKLLSHFTYDLNSLTAGLTTLFGQALREPLKMSACLIGASIISWRLLVLSLLMAPPALYLMRKLAQSLKRANRRAMEEMSQLYGNFSETFAGVVTVKAFTMEQFERTRFHYSAKEFFRKAMRIALYSSLIKPVTELLGIGVISLALVAGGFLVIGGQTHLLGIRMSDHPLSNSELLLFYGFLAGVSDPARKLSSVFASLQAACAGADRVFPLIDRKSAIVDPATPQVVARPHKRLTYEATSFHYESQTPVLKSIDLEVPFGETVAIVGPNGCGKSTLINLVLRFYDPTDGRVCLDGVDLREMRVRDLRNRIGLVAQKPHLFDDTVMNNIRYGLPGASPDAVIAAAKKAHAHRFITNKLPEGYETRVGQGGNLLSGGQRQRIALARAFLRDPEILLLDEATSELDLESEQHIHQALRDFVRGRTALIVTHRLSTIHLADRIVVFDAGEIKDVGSHDELLRRCPLYSRLHDIQFNQSA